MSQPPPRAQQGSYAVNTDPRDQHWVEQGNTYGVANLSDVQRLQFVMLQNFDQVNRNLDMANASLQNLVVSMDTNDNVRRFGSSIMGVLPNISVWKGNDKDNHELNSQQVRALEEDIKKMKEDKAKREDDQQVLNSLKNSLEDEKQGLEEKNFKYRAEIENLSSKLKAARTKSHRLNEIILARGRDTEPQDSVVKNRYREIRDIIQKIVHKYYMAVDDKYLVKRESKKPNIRDRQHHCFSGWGRFDLEDKRLMMRSYIYEIIHKHLFDQACFGLDDNTEQALVSFEERLKHNEDITDEELVEWRRCTVIAAGKVQKENSAPYKLKEVIWEFMLPVVTPIADSVVREQTRKVLETELLTLAQKATWRNGDAADDSEDSEMDIVKMPHGVDPSRAVIAYNVHGALVKRRPKTATDDGSRDVLVKAEVVCYARH